MIGANASTASALVGQAPTTAAVATPAPEIEHTKIVLSQDAALVTVTLASPLVYSNPTRSYQLLDANMSALSPSWSTIVASLSADKQSIEARVPIDENGQSAGISFYVSAVDNSGSFRSPTVDAAFAAEKNLRDAIAQLSKLTNDSQSLADENRQLASDKSSLSKALVTLSQGAIPDFPTVIDVQPFDTYAIVHVRTNRNGRVQIRTTLKAAPSAWGQPTPTPYGTDWFVRVPGLSPGQEYLAEVSVLDAKGAPTSRRLVAVASASPTDRVEPILDFSTHKLTQSMFVDVKCVPAPTSITCSLSVNPKAIVRVNLARKSALGIVDAPITKGDDFTRSNLDLPTSPPAAFSNTLTVTFTDLQPQTSYTYTVDAMSDDGDVTSFNAGTGIDIQTTAPAPPFEFVSFVSVGLDPTKGLSVTWNASSVASAGSVSLDFGHGAMFITPATITNGTTLSATIPEAEVISQSNTDSGSTTPSPNIVVAMQNAIKADTIKFKLNLVLPPQGSVNSNSSLGRVVAGSQQPQQKKFSWQDLVSVGLGIILGR